MRRKFYLPLIFTIILSTLYAGGISVDAGLTPPKSRLIFRTQARFMNREMTPSGMEMKMRGNPLVVAYGVSPKLALMGRVIRMTRLESMISAESSGWSDFLLLGKFRLLRKNTATQTIGLAGVLAGEFPTGSDGFSGDTYNGIAGLQGSLRRGFLAAELNLETKLGGLFSDESDLASLSINSALAWLIPLGSSGSVALTPVIELTQKTEWQNESAAKQFWLSPGMKLTVSSVILEGLLQYPLAQSNENFDLKPGGLVGLRIML